MGGPGGGGDGQGFFGALGQAMAAGMNSAMGSGSEGQGGYQGTPGEGAAVGFGGAGGAQGGIYGMPMAYPSERPPEGKRWVPTYRGGRQVGWHFEAIPDQGNGDRGDGYDQRSPGDEGDLTFNENYQNSGQRPIGGGTASQTFYNPAPGTKPITSVTQGSTNDQNQAKALAMMAMSMLGMPGSSKNIFRR